jgi:predicted phosphodiesterase
MLYIAFILLINICVSAMNCDVSQIHISQGINPRSMTISWLTKDDCYSHVAYGRNNEVLDNYMYGKSVSYNFTYTLNKPTFYQSGYIHHVLIDELQPNTLYFYKCGDFVNKIKSELLNFITLPDVGDHRQISFGIIGDLGQTDHSLETVNHILQDRSVKMILHAGDLSYADCNQPLWDSYGEMIEPLAKKIPWMVCAGNHEIEYNGTNKDGLFTAFEKRYQMPYVQEAEFGEFLIDIAIKPSTNLPYCTPSIFQTEYNYGNSFYSFESGSAHIIYLNPYSSTNETSKQYNWLKNNLQLVNRNATPWVIIVMHCPWYSSNVNHYGDTQTVIMRESMEQLFYENNVNIVFSGHVHSYERSYPVYKNNTNLYGPVYITIGDGGNLEGHDDEYYEQPKWSAFRNGTQYGYGTLTLLDKNRLLWKWFRNKDKQLEFKDELLLCNSIFGNTECF